MAYSFFPNDFHSHPNLQQNATMNYLTQHYKNLSEQLQEQLNHLENLILEYRKTPTRKVSIGDIDWDGEEVPLITGRVVTQRGNPAGKGAAQDRAVGFYPGMGSMPNYGKGIPSGTDEADAEEAIADWGRPTVDNNPLYASLKGTGPAQDVRRRDLFVVDRDRKGGSVPGTGKKAMKKERAIYSAEYDARQQARAQAGDPNRNFTGMNLSIIDRVGGTAYDQSGDGADFIAQGADGKHYTFNSAAKWAWDNEDPGEAPKTFEVNTSNPDHALRDVRAVDWTNPHHARQFYRYHPDFRG